MNMFHAAFIIRALAKLLDSVTHARSEAELRRTIRRLDLERDWHSVRIGDIELSMSTLSELDEEEEDEDEEY